jgi:hypothetical protein
LGHFQDESAPSTADVQMKRPARIRENGIQVDGRWLLSVERRKGINVLMNSDSGHLKIAATAHFDN